MAVVARRSIGGTRRTLCAGLATCLMLGTFPSPATAECAGGTSVRFGDTVEKIAQRCGVNVEKLKQANPGIGQRDLANGGFVAVPAPALPSPLIPLRGNGSRARVTSPNITLR